MQDSTPFVFNVFVNECREDEGGECIVPAGHEHQCEAEDHPEHRQHPAIKQENGVENMS